MNDMEFDLQELVYTYGDGTSGLGGVTASVPRGKTVAVLGANGAGKTTLFMHLVGVYRPDSGTVKYKGRPLTYGSRELKALRREIGMVIQDSDSQLFSADVYQDVSFGPLNLGLGKDEVRRRVERALEAVGLAGLGGRPTHALSHGEKKRAALAGVLAMEPRVLICDEPTAGLDPQGALQLAGLLRRLRDNGVTVIFSTHDVDLAYGLADWCLVLNRGRLAREGSPEEVFQDDTLLEAAGLTKPWVLDVFEEVCRGGRGRRAPPPGNREELFAVLRQGVAYEDHTGGESGNPRVYALYKQPLSGAGIEAESFRRIEAEAPARGFREAQWAVVRRMVHATADFALVDQVRFSPGAVEAGLRALRDGAPIYTDTNMVRAGISLARLQRVNAGYGAGDIRCLVADPAVTAESRAGGLPRSLYAVRRAREILDGGIVLIGNSPVALMELNRMVLEGEARPALVIGVPVGFVNVVEGKKELVSLDIPWITIAGRRGGSSLAVAALHALTEPAGGGEGCT